MSYNKAYHGYFEGYVERKVRDPRTGRQKIERIYAGDYYTNDLEPKKWIQMKVVYCLCTLWALAVFVMAGTTDIGGSGTSPYVAICVGITLILLVWFIYELVCFLMYKPMLKIRQYKARDQMRNLGMASAVGFLAIGVSELVFLIRNKGQNMLGLILIIVLCITAFFVLYGVYKAESSLNYRKVPNEIAVPKDSYDIKMRGDAETTDDEPGPWA